ncbi:hypothetical protein [Kitasatospora sp. A2-31]|uniref:hypothetical protein n=1 Tax=Kitasatospora sp. A2-31 TaxID=2916414 RepID=UPI001EEAB50A|nr:hypothetical protein [Kitasatospora sp. A2-31]MCG6494096.1 hypothetical protein [Kitasatospora sp. A2-31]
MPNEEVDGDPLRRRLTTMVERLRQELDGVAEIEERDDGWFWDVSVRPESAGPLGFSWLVPGDSADIVFAVEAGGVSWELGRSVEQVDLMAAMVDALLAGRATAVFGRGRCEVTVTLADGTEQVQSNRDLPTGCLPLPGWSRRGRRIDYEPYGPSVHRRPGR